MVKSYSKLVRRATNRNKLSISELEVLIHGQGGTWPLTDDVALQMTDVLLGDSETYPAFCRTHFSLIYGYFKSIS